MSINTTPASAPAGVAALSSTFWNAEVRDVSAGIQAAWDAWTPTLTGFVVGNGTLVARYRRVGKTVDYRIQFTAGSTSTFSGGFIITLPVAPSAIGYPAETVIGNATLYDASAGPASRSGGTVSYTGSGGVFILSDRTSPATVGNTAPWTWTTGDTFSIVGTYEAA